MPSTSLSLIVIRATNLERARAFYASLGLHLIQEKHGSGPEHYSCEFGSVVLEIYPGRKVGGQPGYGLLGFTVASVAATFETVKAIGCDIISPPAPSEREVRAIVRDPDGQRIELVEFQE